MANTSTTTQQPAPRGAEHRAGECPPDHDLPENSKENLDAKLDHAIEETFPTSDPVSVSITKGGAIDYDRQGTSQGTSARSDSRSGGVRDAADNLVGQAKEVLRDAAGTASEAARSAYDQGRRYMREAGSRYPEAGRYYQEGSRAVSRSVADNPWLALLVAGAVGYALAWLIHGRSDRRERRVPDYARTRRDYAR